MIYAVAPSPLDINRIWAGTDDGLIWLTTDGGAHWNNITPPQLSAWQKVSVLEASHFDPQTAYAAINTLRLDDLRPHIYRTRDSGKTWTEIANGIPDNENVNSVREDPKRKGLLFAGTERAVYVSFDDGDHWQSLRLNMPATSVRDLTIKDNDLAVGTHGRGFWILDDITPLRQLDDKVVASNAFLFAPELAYRVRWDTNTDTPLPPDEPAGQNPPDGAIFNYYLKSAAAGPVTLEILDSAGTMVRRYSSADPFRRLTLSCPFRRIGCVRRKRCPARRDCIALSGTCTTRRCPASSLNIRLPRFLGTPLPAPTSPWVMPGKYSVVLTVDGQRYTQPLTIEMDPRVKTSTADLQKQFELSKQIYDDLLALQPVVNKAAAALTKLKSMREKASGPEAAKIDAAIKELESLQGGEGAAADAGRKPIRSPVCTHRSWRCCPCCRRWTRRPRRRRRKPSPS